MLKYLEELKMHTQTWPTARNVIVLCLYNGLYGTEIYLWIHDAGLLDYF